MRKFMWLEFNEIGGLSMISFPDGKFHVWRHVMNNKWQLLLSGAIDITEKGLTFTMCC